ncbi:MAG TPA: hypothetical protein VHA06_09940 [Candidatus Angelobacter sp.]|jgi:hypothetical protein|nr:hypothetical protein [Candidatus Angelobacter sp.]
MVALLWCIFGFTGFALLALPSSAWKALWQPLQDVRESSFSCEGKEIDFFLKSVAVCNKNHAHK